jgi:hypothetical protein
LNLILILKELWHRRALAALSIFLAAAISVLAVFQVSFSPPGVSKRSQAEAQGSIAILVDSARSPIADAKRDLLGLTARAGVFARYMAGGNVVGEIAEANDIPVEQIDVAGPSPLPGQAPGIESVKVHPYGIAISQQPELPIVNVETRAPTVREARGLAAAAPEAVSRIVSSVQAEQGTPAEKQVQFRVLGPAQATPVDEAMGKKMAIVLFLVLLAIFIALILGVPRLVVAWRAADADTLSPPSEETELPPEIVHLPSGRTGENEGEDRPPTVIGRRGDP